MPRKRHLDTAKTPPYGNVKVLDLEGRLIFRCGLDKADWYLSRSLANKIADEPLTIQLAFKANGPGHFGDPFFLQEKHNRCVVCSSEESLTRHHIVPYCYRQFFPRRFKCHSSYDVMILCRPCHRRYEEAADRLKAVYAKKHGIPVGGRRFKEELHKERVRNDAHTLLTAGYKMPKERIEVFIKRFQDYFGCEEVTIKMLIEARNMQVKETYIPHGQVVVLGEPDLYAFCKEWRHHFLKVMEPKFMPDFWCPERHIDRSIAGDKSRKPGFVTSIIKAALGFFVRR